MMDTGGPWRTCVGCRKRRKKRALLRVVADERGHLRPDAGQVARGRGAYLCPDAGCVEAACRRSAWNRALRRRVVLPGPGDLCRALLGASREHAVALVERGLADGRLARRGPGEEHGVLDISAIGGDLEAVLVADRRLGHLLESLVARVRRLHATQGQGRAD